MIEVNYFANISYGFLKQRPQQLFEAWLGLGKPGFRFRYVEPPWVNLKVHEETVTRLIGLPLADPRHMQAVEAMLAVLQAGEAETRVAVAPVFWEPFLAKPAFDLICYDLFDAVSHEAYGFEAIEAMHRNLLGKSDLVFVTTEDLGLAARCISSDAKVVVVSNGVDAEFFQTRAAGEPPDDFVKIRPVAGFLGAVYDWVDLDLVRVAALALPEVDFVLVGPLSRLNGERTGQMPPNMRFLGEKDYAAVPAYLNLFDVAFIPFAPGPISAAADPIKLYEYFALGKPVVAAHTRQIERYDDGRLLRVARTADEFAAAIASFLVSDRPAWREERRRIAAANSWRSKAALMLAEIERLGP